MWAFIIGLIYDQSCQKYLTDVAMHQHRWMQGPVFRLALRRPATRVRGTIYLNPLPHAR